MSKDCERDLLTLYQIEKLLTVSCKNLSHTLLLRGSVMLIKAGAHKRHRP